MPLPKEIDQPALDAEVEAIAKSVETLQDGAHAERGRYVQLLATHDAPPADGTAADVKTQIAAAQQYAVVGTFDAAKVPAEFDGADVVSTTEATAKQPAYVTLSKPPPTFADAGLPAKTLARYSCDAYAGPDGRGWVLHAEILAGGRTYRRSIAVGPEEHRGTAGEWVEVTAPGLPK